MKKLFFILLALCVVFFLASCDDGGSSGGGGGRGSAGTFVIVDVTPHDGVDEIHTISGGIEFTSGGADWVLKDKIMLNDDGTITDKVSLKMDGNLVVDCEYSGTWAPSGNKINVHLTEEKDKLAGTTNAINVNGSATLSEDGETLTADQKQQGMNFYYIYKKQ